MAECVFVEKQILGARIEQSREEIKTKTENILRYEIP